MEEQSFMKALFFGVIAEDAIFPFPSRPDDERRALHGTVDEVARFLDERVDSDAIDAEGRIDAASLDGARALGLFGLAVSPEHGGSFSSTTAHARVIEEIAARDASLAMLLVAHGALGSGALIAFGTQAQKQRYLPRLARGELVGAFALTERASGADAGAIRTYAELEPGEHAYRLTGTKPWVMNGDVGSLVTVFARTSRADEGHKPRLTALLVERGEGVTTGSRRETLGLRGLGITKLEFDGVRVPVEQQLEEPGHGFKVAMEVLNDARPIIAAAMVGQARSSLNLALERLSRRRSFGRVIGQFPLLKDKLARMMADLYAIESMTYLTTGLIDRGMPDYSLESAICRVAGAEALWRIVNDATAIAAGGGYLQGHPLERRLRDARGAFFIDGTNETLRCFIALAGMQGPGQRLSEVVGAMREPVKGFGLLRGFAVRKVREALRRERVTRAHPLLAREAVMLEEGVDALAKVVERVLREHRAEIAEEQYAQLRIANVAIDLYALAACLSRATLTIEKHGEVGARRELDLVTMFATAASGRIDANLRRLEENDDQLRKEIAARAYTDGRYPFDVL